MGDDEPGCGGWDHGKWEMGNGKWEMGNGKWEMGNGKWEMGNGKGERGREEMCSMGSVICRELSAGGAMMMLIWG